MTTGSQTDFLEIVALHQRLEDKLERSGGEVFVSDWNGSHPFTEQYLGNLAKTKIGSFTASSYCCFDDDSDLFQKILQFHRTRDGVEPEGILLGAGSTALLASICLHFFSLGTRQLFYVPPLYHTFLYMMKLLGFSMRPISGRHAFEPGFTMNLPREKAVLVLTDPIWYAGRSVPASSVMKIRAWQQDTGSWVIVDGSFQHMRWDGARAESTAALLPSRTLRLICPSKSLAIHGYRFAYVLLPSESRRSITKLHENVHGAASVADLAFAHKALGVLSSREGNTGVIEHIRHNYDRLMRANAFIEHVVPDCGYFMFGRPRRSKRDCLFMGPEYFDQRRYPEYIRVNLLNEAAVSFLLETK